MFVIEQIKPARAYYFQADSPALKTMWVDHINRLGWTALLEAILLSDGGPRHQQIVQLLLAAGANPNLADGDGVRPLLHAQQRGYTAMADLLCAAGGR